MDIQFILSSPKGRANSRYIKKNYPKEYDEIIKYKGETFSEQLYNYIYNAQVSDETTHYVKGQLIMTDIDDDYHSYQALNNELDMGIRFPVGG